MVRLFSLKILLAVAKKNKYQLAKWNVICRPKD
jgi:hypothetical protein